MSTHFTQQIELKFWQVIIPQLNPGKPLGKLVRKANQVKEMAKPLFRFCIIAVSGGFIGMVGGAILFLVTRP